MKINFFSTLVVLYLLINISGHAEEPNLSTAKLTDIDEADASLQERTIQAGVSVSNTTYPDNSRNFSFDSTYRYFAADFFSLGLIVSFSEFEDPDDDYNSSRTGFGPTFNYYFYTIDRFAFSVGHDIISVNRKWEDFEDDNYVYTRSYLQSDYFITRNLSFGISYNVVESDEFNNNTINTKFKYYF